MATEWNKMDLAPKNREIVLVTNGTDVAIAMFETDPAGTASGDCKPTFPKPVEKGDVIGWLPLSALPPLPKP